MSKKRLCKLVKDDFLDKHMDEYKEMVRDGKYVCKKCGRAARKEEALCKPKSLQGE